MRKTLLAAAFLALVTPMFAAADFSGTWKLNTQTSTGPEQPTETQLVAVVDGNIQTITVTRTTSDGTPGITKFSIPLKGGAGTIIEAPFKTVAALPSTPTTQDLTFTIDGKPAMHIQSVLSADGKTMTTTRTVTAGPMKPGTYTDVWERQS